MSTPSMNGETDEGSQTHVTSRTPREVLRAVCVGMLEPREGTCETRLHSCLIDAGASIHHVELLLRVRCNGDKANCPYGRRDLMVTPDPVCRQGRIHNVSFSARRTQMCYEADNEDSMRFGRGGVMAMVGRSFRGAANQSDSLYQFIRLDMSQEQLRQLEHELLRQLDHVVDRDELTSACPSSASGYNYLGYVYKLVRACCCIPCACPIGLQREFACGATQDDILTLLEERKYDVGAEFPLRALTCDEYVALSLMLVGYLDASDPTLMSPEDVFRACLDKGATMVSRRECISIA